MGGNQFHFHCVWFGENRGDWKLPPGGGGGEGEGVGETKVGEKTLLVFSCLVGSGKWVVPCTFHRAHQNLISPNWRKNGRENWKELRITILSLENH